MVTRTIENVPLWGNDLALDFANTTEAADKDHLRTYDDLVTWAHRTGALPADARPRGELTRARELRAAIYEVFTAGSGLEVVLDVYADAVRNGTIEDGEWRWSGTHPDRPLWPVAAAAVDLLRSDRLDRVKVCGNCDWLFVDASRNRSRRWCSMDECGAHVKMRRYRAARRGG